MKIKVTLLFFILLFFVTGNNKLLSQKLHNDTFCVTTIKAKFVKKISDEYCGFIHLPGKNMFEIRLLENGKYVRKYFEMQYSTGCTGNTFIAGNTYSFDVIRLGNNFYSGTSKLRLYELPKSVFPIE